MKSLISKEKECYVCGTTLNLHKHHIYYGSSSSRNSADKHGCWVYLCAYHHNMSNEGVHNSNKQLDKELKEKCQRIFEEKIGTRDYFRKLFKKSFL